MTPRRRGEERELQELLRNVAAIVMLILIALIVVVALAAPFLHATLDSTLILGLFAALMGALPVLLGVQFLLKKEQPKDE